MLTPKTLAGLLVSVLVSSSMPSPAPAQPPEAFRAATTVAEFLGGPRISERAADVARGLRGRARYPLPGDLEEHLTGVSEAELLEALQAIDPASADQLQKALASLPAVVETISPQAKLPPTSGPSGIGERATTDDPLTDARLRISVAKDKLGRARAGEPGDLCRLELSCQVRELITNVEKLLEAIECENSACVTVREGLAADARRVRLELEWASLRREYVGVDRIGTAMDRAASIEKCLGEGDPCGCISHLAHGRC